MTAPTRRRGRPAGGGGNAREAILAAARARFAGQGYASASLRSIAADAGVDVALIAHYFGSKRDLMMATLDMPFDVTGRISAVLDAGPDGLGGRLVRTFLTSWDPHREVISSLLRSAATGAGDAGGVADVAREILLPTLSANLTGPDARLRAALMASAMTGLALQRYVIALPPLAQAPVDDIVKLYGPVIDRLATDRPLE